MLVLIHLFLHLLEANYYDARCVVNATYRRKHIRNEQKFDCIISKEIDSLKEKGRINFPNYIVCLSLVQIRN